MSYGMLLIMLANCALKDKDQDLFCSFTCTLAEAAGLLENLSLDSQTKTTGNPALATKVTYLTINFQDSQSYEIV